MIRALVFDLDGTLVDSLPGIASSLNRALESLGRPIHPPTAVRGFVGHGVTELARRALPDNAPPSLVSQLADAFRGDYSHSWSSGTHLYPGVPETLAQLQSADIPLAIWSNKPHEFTIDMVADLFPDTRFAIVLGQRENVPRKPDPASAPDLARALGRPAAETALVGDSLTDIKSARNAGWTAIAIGSGYEDPDTLRAANPDHWLDNITELPARIGIDPV